MDSAEVLVEYFNKPIICHYDRIFRFANNSTIASEIHCHGGDDSINSRWSNTRQSGSLLLFQLDRLLNIKKKKHTSTQLEHEIIRQTQQTRHFFFVSIGNVYKLLIARWRQICWLVSRYLFLFISFTISRESFIYIYSFFFHA